MKSPRNDAHKAAEMDEAVRRPRSDPRVAAKRPNDTVFMSPMHALRSIVSQAVPEAPVKQLSADLLEAAPQGSLTRSAVALAPDGNLPLEQGPGRVPRLGREAATEAPCPLGHVGQPASC